MQVALTEWGCRSSPSDLPDAQFFGSGIILRNEFRGEVGVDMVVRAEKVRFICALIVCCS